MSNGSVGELVRLLRCLTSQGDLAIRSRRFGGRMEPKFNSTAFMWQMLKSGRESAREEGDPYRIEEAERQISGTARNILKNPSLITRLKLDGYANYVEEMQAFVTSSSAPSSSAQPDLINMVQFEEFLGVLTDAQLAAVEAAVLAERTKRRAS